MHESAFQQALAALETESEALLEQRAILDRETFSRAVEILLSARCVAVGGCGHSGIACAHFAHLLCCMGRSARCLPPSEALHGAMGFLHRGDALVLASRGGETQELLPMERIARERGVTIIAITENCGSALALGSDLVLPMHVTQECDRDNCQGTTSFVVLSALFDALQTAMIQASGYRAAEFAQIHPGGAVGARLNRGKENL